MLFSSTFSFTRLPVPEIESGLKQQIQIISSIACALALWNVCKCAITSWRWEKKSIAKHVFSHFQMWCALFSNLWKIWLFKSYCSNNLFVLDGSGVCYINTTNTKLFPQQYIVRLIQPNEHNRCIQYEAAGYILILHCCILDFAILSKGIVQREMKSSYRLCEYSIFLERITQILFHRY